MRKIFSVLSIALVAFGLASCKGGKSVPDEPIVPETPVAPEDATLVNVARVQVQPMGTCIAYMLFDDVSGKGFVFPLVIPSGAEDVEPGKTYVFPDEMNRTYAYWMLSDYTTHALYTEATFKKTVKADEKWRIDATATDTNGDKWVLLFDEN